MSRQTDKRPKNHTYEYGNTVRQFEALPEYPDYHNERKKRKEERRISEQKRRRRRAARRNRERALRMSAGYVAFLSVCAGIVGIICAAYVNLQSDLIIRQKRMEALESTISELKLENDAMYKRITTSVDLKTLKKKAKKLGMKYPTQKQIIYYSIDKSDYMTQYSQ